jgi:molybdate/tungstate transport system substrate-binding protein
MLSIRRICILLLSAVGAFLTAGAAQAQTCASGSPQLIVFHAGSLTAALSQVESLFTQQTGVCVSDNSGGSLDVARRITAGAEPCDVFASADYAVIDLLLKPSGFADYNILFGRGGMVLAYTVNSRAAGTIAASGKNFAPPGSIPNAAADWYTQLTQTDVTIGSSNPFLDPSGYRNAMIFQLAEDRYGVPNLYDTLLRHYVVLRPSDALGQTYDYQLIYEHEALAAYKKDAADYRYVKLPRSVSLADPNENARYSQAGVVVPGLRLPGTERDVRIPATRVIWGVTVLKTAPNPDNAVKFLQLLFGDQGVALQGATGPAPISPPLVSDADYGHLPASLQSLVRIRSQTDD